MSRFPRNPAMGRIVIYCMLDPLDLPQPEYPAMIINEREDIIDSGQFHNEICDLLVLGVLGGGDIFNPVPVILIKNVSYSEESKQGTWHWPEIKLIGERSAIQPLQRLNKSPQIGDPDIHQVVNKIAESMPSANHGLIGASENYVEQNQVNLFKEVFEIFRDLSMGASSTETIIKNLINKGYWINKIG